MAIDYAEKEREFLESLAEDTGRDLAGWMSAIAATSLTDRNAIIDWLRQQGFLFARASWLERIYHNGGRPIYFDANAGLVTPPRVKPEPAASLSHATRAASAATPPAPATVKAAPVENTAIVASSVPAKPAVQSEAPSLNALLAEAKAYRPLAQYVLREIEKAHPHLSFLARDGFVAIHGPHGLAGVLTITPKELRLALALPDGPAPAPFIKGKVTKTHPEVPAEISHLVVLTDARQVTGDLIAAVGQAARVT